MTENELNKKIKGLKDTCLKKPDPSHSDIIQTSTQENNITITLKNDVFDKYKELFNEQNYKFSLFKPLNTEEAPDYKTDKNNSIHEFLESKINEDEDFFYKKLSSKHILKLIEKKLNDKSGKDKDEKSIYDFKIELCDISGKKEESSDNILPAGEYSIKIEGLFITKDKNQSVEDLKNLMKELENKSKVDPQFATSEDGNEYINQKKTEFTKLKNNLKNIEFCKLFLKSNEELFSSYIGILTDKIELLGVDKDVQKIISDIYQKRSNFIEEIKTWQYTNFSGYIDETNKIKNEKVEAYINNLITEAIKNNKDKEKKITNYFTKKRLDDNINSLKTALNTRLSELNSLHKDKNDDKPEGGERNGDTSSSQNPNTGNGGSNGNNGDEVKKRCCAKFKCSGCKKNNK